MASREPPGDERTRALLDAALTLFGRYGYRRTSVDDIAREARVAKGAVYLSFQSKEELFRTAAQQVIERALAAAALARGAPGPIETRLLAFLEARFSYLFELAQGAPHAWELIDPEGTLSADLLRQAERRYQTQLTELLAAADARGELRLARAALTPSAAAALLIRSAHGNDLPEPTGAAPSMHAYRRRLAEMVRVHVLGFGGNPGPAFSACTARPTAG